MNSSLILVGKVAGTAALATGALVTGVSATHSSSADASASSTKAAHCGRGFGHADSRADPQLTTALKAARAEPKGKERREALRKIRKDAVKGTYGDAAEIRALHLRIGQLHYRALAPDALKSALKAAAAKPAGEERKAAFQQIQKDAAAGTYGAKVEKIAKKRQERRATCQSQRQERKSQKSSPSPSPSTSEGSES